MVTRIYCVHGLKKNCCQSIYMLIAVLQSNKNTHCHIISWHITDYLNCIPCLNLNRLSKFQKYDRFFFYWHFLVWTYFQSIKSVVNRCSAKLLWMYQFFYATVNIEKSIIRDAIIYEMFWCLIGKIFIESSYLTNESRIYLYAAH